MRGRSVELVCCFALAPALAACGKTSAVGQACDNTKDCVAGTECVVLSGPSPPIGDPEGTCLQQCFRDAECSAAEPTCHHGHCRRLAPLGAACDRAPCGPEDKCIVSDGIIASLCRRRCILRSDCAPGESCVHVALPGPMPTSPPFRDGEFDQVCLPAPSAK